MPRAPTTADAFNAIAEPQRRRILELLRGRERAAGEVARLLRMAQPQASKHLRVLRRVGLVRVREAGRERRYSLDARGLRPVHEWTGGFERFWGEAFARLDAHVQELKEKEAWMTPSEAVEAESEREIVTSRAIVAPRHLVFRAFTEARHLARWFGPDGFTLTTHAFSFKVGGVWDFTMHGPDGTDYPNWIRWREITPPERLVFEQGGRADDPEAFESTVTFIEREGVTEITLRALFKTRAQRDRAVKEFHAIEGGSQTLGRLARYAVELANAGG
jgi:uncharacterized protein YndB with AHSA1/START domain/DNA-binding transcriptional ArsR family regulator